MLKCLLFLTVISSFAYLCPASDEVDSDKTAEISRFIREQFRQTGMIWVSPRQMKLVNLTSNTKPLMFYFSFRSCQVCQEFLVDFKQHQPSVLAQLSAQFYAVHVLDEDNWDFGPEFAPGGQDYTPRVIFADPDGRIRPDLTAPGSPSVSLYAYSDVNELIKTMRIVLELYNEMIYPSDIEHDLPS